MKKIFILPILFGGIIFANNASAVPGSLLTIKGMSVNPLAVRNVLNQNPFASKINAKEFTDCVAEGRFSSNSVVGCCNLTLTDPGDIKTCPAFAESVAKEHNRLLNDTPAKLRKSLKPAGQGTTYGDYYLDSIKDGTGECMFEKKTDNVVCCFGDYDVHSFVPCASDPKAKYVFLRNEHGVRVIPMDEYMAAEFKYAGMPLYMDVWLKRNADAASSVKVDVPKYQCGGSLDVNDLDSDLPHLGQNTSKYYNFQSGAKVNYDMCSGIPGVYLSDCVSAYEKAVKTVKQAQKQLAEQDDACRFVNEKNYLYARVSEVNKNANTLDKLSNKMYTKVSDLRANYKIKSLLEKHNDLVKITPLGTGFVVTTANPRDAQAAAELLVKVGIDTYKNDGFREFKCSGECKETSGLKGHLVTCKNDAGVTIKYLFDDICTAKKSEQQSKKSSGRFLGGLF